MIKRERASKQSIYKSFTLSQLEFSIYLKATFLFKNEKWKAGRHFVRQILFLRDHGILRALNFFSPEQVLIKPYKIIQGLIFEVKISVD